MPGEKRSLEDLLKGLGKVSDKVDEVFDSVVGEAAASLGSVEEEEKNMESENPLEEEEVFRGAPLLREEEKKEAEFQSSERAEEDKENATVSGTEKGEENDKGKDIEDLTNEILNLDKELFGEGSGKVYGPEQNESKEKDLGGIAEDIFELKELFAEANRQKEEYEFKEKERTKREESERREKEEKERRAMEEQEEEKERELRERILKIKERHRIAEERFREEIDGKGVLSNVEQQRLGNILEGVEVLLLKFYLEIGEEIEDKLRRANNLLLEAELIIDGALTKELSENIKNSLLYFGITEEELKNRVPEFFKMTEGQQAFVLENLNQAALRKIEEEGYEEFSRPGQRGLLGLGSILYKSWFKELEKGRLKHKAAKKAGFIYYGDLRELTNMVQSANLDIEFGEGGKPKLRYISFEQIKKSPEWQNRGDIHYGDAIREELLETDISEFNRAADVFVNLFVSPSAGAEVKNEFKEHYEEKRNNCLNALVNAIGEREAFEIMSGADLKVNLSRFLTTHLEVQKELDSIRSNKFITKGFASVAMERAGAFAAGFGIRAGAAVFLTALGAPILVATLAAVPVYGAILGGYRARKRVKEAVFEKEKMSQSGFSGTREEEVELSKMSEEYEEKVIKNLEEKLERIEKNPEKELFSEEEQRDLFIVLSEKEKNKIIKSREKAAVKAVEKKINRLEKGKIILQKKDYVKAENLANKMERVINLFESLAIRDLRYAARGERRESLGLTHADEIKTKTQGREELDILMSLERAVKYTEKKMESGLIDFGKERGGIAERYNFAQVYGKAKSLTAAYLDGKTREEFTHNFMEAFEGLELTKTEEAKKKYEHREKSNKKLDEALEARKEKISKAKRRKIFNQTVYGGAMTAASATAGWLARDLFWNEDSFLRGSFKKETPRISEREAPPQFDKEKNRLSPPVESHKQSVPLKPEERRRSAEEFSGIKEDPAPQGTESGKDFNKMEEEELLREMEKLDLESSAEKSFMVSSIFGPREAAAGEFLDKFKALPPKEKEIFKGIFKDLSIEEKAKIVKASGAKNKEESQEAITRHIFTKLFKKEVSASSVSPPEHLPPSSHKYSLKQDQETLEQKREALRKPQERLKTERFAPPESKKAPLSLLENPEGARRAEQLKPQKANPPENLPIRERVSAGTKIKKGEGFWDAAKRLVEKGEITEKQHQEAWEKSKVIIRGKEVPLSEAGYVIYDKDNPVELIYNNKKGIYEVSDPSKKVGTNADYLENLKSRGKTPPSWLEKESRPKNGFQKLQEEADKLMHKTQESSEEVLEVPAIQEEVVEKAGKGEILPPKEAIYEDVSHYKELYKDRLSAEDVENLAVIAGEKQGDKITDENFDDLLTKISKKPEIFKSPEGEFHTEKVGFLDNHKEMPLEKIEHIFNTAKGVNKSLNINFVIEEIHEKFFGGKDLNIITEPGRIRIEDEGYNIILSEEGIGELSEIKTNKPVAVSNLTGGLIYEKIDLNSAEFNAERILQIKYNILEQFEKEEEIFGKLNNIRKTGGFLKKDITEEELRNMLHKITMKKLLSNEWTNKMGILKSDSARRITEFIRGLPVIDESRLEEEMNTTAGNILAKNAKDLVK